MKQKAKDYAFSLGAGIIGSLVYLSSMYLSGWLQVFVFILLCSGEYILGYINGKSQRKEESK